MFNSGYNKQQKCQMIDPLYLSDKAENRLEYGFIGLSLNLLILLLFNKSVLFSSLGAHDLKSATMISLSAIILLMSTFHFLKELFQVYCNIFLYCKQGTIRGSFTAAITTGKTNWHELLHTFMIQNCCMQFKLLSQDAIFLATCNAVTLERCKIANTRLHTILSMYSSHIKHFSLINIS